MSVQGTDITVRMKKQAGLGTLASGAGATQFRVLPGSQGLQRNNATIERGILDRSGMKARARQGSTTATAAYNLEVEPDNLPVVFAGAVGGTEIAAISLDEGDLTSATISSTGTVVTFGGGDLLAAGVVAGMLGRFSGLATTANNGVWFPILGVTTTTLSVPSGFLTDETADTAFGFETAPCYYTPTPRLKEYFTVEEYYESIDASKQGEDMRFTGLSFSVGANQIAQASVTLAGRDVTSVASGSAPIFTSPDAPEGDGLVLLDGALYRDGVAAIDLTSVQLGIGANAQQTPLATSRKSADVGMQQFAFTGSIAGLLTSMDQFTASVNEDQVSMLLILAERGAMGGTTGELVAIYAGNCSYAQSNAPIAEGDVVETTPLYGGKDTRGAGFAASTLVISKTAA
jgi:hypothetical protein